MLRVQLHTVSLVGHEDTNLHREHTLLFSLDEGQVPEFQVHIVMSLKILVNGDFLRLTRSSVKPIELGVLGMRTLFTRVCILEWVGKLMDGIDLIICRRLLWFPDKFENVSTNHHPCLCA